VSVKHTPGPWGVDEMLTINAPSTLMVAECSCAANRPMWSGTDYSTRSHQEANARLIASAPDLLHALDTIGGLCRALRAGGPDPIDLKGLSDALSEAVDIAHAAIAKATGEQP